MAKLWDRIREAVRDERFLVSVHADERCEERGISDWQVVAGVVDARVEEERSSDQPNPSVVVRQTLEDGSEIVAVWAWLSHSRRAKLVTVYFPDLPS